MADSRRAARRASPAAGLTARSPFGTRARWGWGYMAPGSPLPWNPIYFSAGKGSESTRTPGKVATRPPAETSWSKVSIIDAGRFDPATAYAAVNRIRLDDQRPHLYRTHDGGKTWKPIVQGLPDNAPVNTVREDPVRKGLLFAGTERAVFVSFDDGAVWQSLRLNMPAASVRELV